MTSQICPNWVLNPWTPIIRMHEQFSFKLDYTNLPTWPYQAVSLRASVWIPRLWAFSFAFSLFLHVSELRFSVDYVWLGPRSCWATYITACRLKVESMVISCLYNQSKSTLVYTPNSGQCAKERLKFVAISLCKFQAISSISSKMIHLDPLAWTWKNEQNRVPIIIN
jgi:hypothetical protein